MKKKKPSKQRHQKLARNGHLEQEQYADCDGTFAFIAGYTEGGAPYGLTWEELGIDPYLPLEEKVRIYHAGGIDESAQSADDIFD